MALSKSLTQPLRKNMLFVGSGWRGFFAPFDYQAALTSTTGGPNILDLERQGPFNTNALPAGYSDLGWIKNFKFTNNTKVGQVRSGYRGIVRAQYRGEVGEQCEFQFREFGRQQYKVATGCQMYNLLSSSGTPSTTSPLGSPGSFAAIVMGASGYVASGAVAGQVGKPTLYVPSGSGAAFAVNNYVVVDIDYVAGTSGVLGEAGAFAYPNAITDTDWIRKTSDYVARVTAIVTGVGSPVQDALILDQVFVGGGSPAATNGIPPTTSKVQIVSGWSARNGGTFIQEWSGLFISDAQDGAQIALYYPHLSISQFRGMNPYTIENIGTTDTTGNELDASFECLGFDDPLDGETVCSYMGYFPNANNTQNVY